MAVALTNFEHRPTELCRICSLGLKLQHNLHFCSQCSVRAVILQHAHKTVIHLLCYCQIHSRLGSLHGLHRLKLNSAACLHKKQTERFVLRIRPLTFSFSRALQEPVLALWKGEASNVQSAQQAFLHRLKLNSVALSSIYTKDMEE